MKIQILYFTRTNNSKRIAETIADTLGCKAIQFTDNRNWSGFLGYMKAGFYSSTDRKVDIEVLGKLEPTDANIVVAPMWAGGIAPAARTLIGQLGRDKVHLVVVSGGSHAKDRAGYKSVRDIAENEKNEKAVIEELVASLR